MIINNYDNNKQILSKVIVIIVMMTGSIIPTNLIANVILSLFCPAFETKKKN